MSCGFNELAPDVCCGCDIREIVLDDSTPGVTELATDSYRLTTTPSVPFAMQILAAGPPSYHVGTIYEVVADFFDADSNLMQFRYFFEVDTVANEYWLKASVNGVESVVDHVVGDGTDSHIIFPNADIDQIDVLVRSTEIEIGLRGVTGPFDSITYQRLPTGEQFTGSMKSIEITGTNLSPTQVSWMGIREPGVKNETCPDGTCPDITPYTHLFWDFGGFATTDPQLHSRFGLGTAFPLPTEHLKKSYNGCNATIQNANVHHLLSDHTGQTDREAIQGTESMTYTTWPPESNMFRPASDRTVMEHMANAQLKDYSSSASQANTWMIPNETEGLPYKLDISVSNATGYGYGYSDGIQIDVTLTLELWWDGFINGFATENTPAIQSFGPHIRNPWTSSGGGSGNQLATISGNQNFDRVPANSNESSSHLAYWENEIGPYPGTYNHSVWTERRLQSYLVQTVFNIHEAVPGFQNTVAWYEANLGPLYLAQNPHEPNAASFARPSFRVFVDLFLALASVRCTRSYRWHDSHPNTVGIDKGGDTFVASRLVRPWSVSPDPPVVRLVADYTRTVSEWNINNPPSITFTYDDCTDWTASFAGAMGANSGEWQGYGRPIGGDPNDGTQHPLSLNEVNALLNRRVRPDAFGSSRQGGTDCFVLDQMIDARTSAIMASNNFNPLTPRYLAPLAANAAQLDELEQEFVFFGQPGQAIYEQFPDYARIHYGYAKANQQFVQRHLSFSLTPSATP